MTLPDRPGRDGRPEVLGRYVLHAELASGGMATVHLARMLGAAGFARTVAVKRLHPQYAKDPEFLAMFLDEARLATRVRHTNVVPIIDVVHAGNELFLVMEYVEGEALGRLSVAANEKHSPIDPRIAVAIIVGVLHGLHAAHESLGDRGEPLGLVHRDVSPQNILVGTDGIARVVDFGIAQAEGRLQNTREGEVKGKMAYLAPELLDGKRGDRRVDVWGASVVLWELLTQRKLFSGDSYTALTAQVVTATIAPPSEVSDAPKSLDPIVMRGLSRDPATRWMSARQMAIALEEALAPATARTVGEWVETTAAAALAARARLADSIVDPANDEGSGAASVRSRLAAVGVGIASRQAPRADGSSAANALARPGSREAEPAEPPTERVEVRGMGGVPFPSSADELAPAHSTSPPRPPILARTRPSPPPRDGSRRWAIAAALVLGVGVLGLPLANRFLRAPERDANPLPSRGTTAEAIALPSGDPSAMLPPPMSASPSHAPSSSAAAAKTAVEVAPTPPIAAPSPRPSSPRTAEGRATGADAAPHQPSPRCDPPYRVVDGIRIPKKECL